MKFIENYKTSIVYPHTRLQSTQMELHVAHDPVTPHTVLYYTLYKVKVWQVRTHTRTYVRTITIRHLPGLWRYFTTSHVMVFIEAALNTYTHKQNPECNAAKSPF